MVFNNFSKKLDKNTVKNTFLGHLQEFLNSSFPNGTLKGDSFKIGSLSGEEGQSLNIQLTGPRAGLWYDFATDEKGDVFDLVAATYEIDVQTDFPKVLCKMAEWTGASFSEADSSEASCSEKKEVSKKRFVWEYMDASGKSLLRVYRHDTSDGKVFKVYDCLSRRWKMPPGKRPLYNLPALVPVEQIVIAEGEKAADALIRQGICATTTLGGANAPITRMDWLCLEGKRILIWPDHDVPGKNYAALVGAYLAAEVDIQSVAILQIPEDKPQKWDAADALEEGLDLKKFIETCPREIVEKKKTALNKGKNPFDINALLENCPQQKTSSQKASSEFQWLDLRRSLEQTPEHLDFVLPGLKFGTIGALVSPGATGKTMLALQCAVTVAGGKDTLDLNRVSPSWKKSSGRVVFLTAEDPEEILISRFHEIGKHVPKNEHEILFKNLFVGSLVGRSPDILCSDWQDWFLEITQNTHLVILDTLRRFHYLDENNGKDMAKILACMEMLCQKNATTLLFLHHTSKSSALNGGDTQQSSRGSSVLTDNVRFQANLIGMNSEQAQKCAIDPTTRHNFVRLSFPKINYCAPIADRWFQRDEGGVLKSYIPQDGKNIYQIRRNLREHE